MIWFNGNTDLAISTVVCWTSQNVCLSFNFATFADDPIYK